MRFLVTNTEGVFAPGLEALVEVLQHFGEVVVVCPEQGSGYALTYNAPLKVRSLDVFGPHIPVYAVTGSQADCIKLAFDVLMPRRPDLIFTGLYESPTFGRDCFGSVLMGGALLSMAERVPMVALSIAHHEPPTNWHYARELCYVTIERVVRGKWGSGPFLNINFPHCTRQGMKGFAVVPYDQTISRYGYIGLHDSCGSAYHWLKEQPLQRVPESSDYGRLLDGQITVTPFEQKRTNRKDVEKLEKTFRMTSGVSG